jgi:hypothetical protein
VRRVTRKIEVEEEFEDEFESRGEPGRDEAWHAIGASSNWTSDSFSNSSL